MVYISIILCLHLFCGAWKGISVLIQHFISLADQTPCNINYYQYIVSVIHINTNEYTQ